MKPRTAASRVLAIGALALGFPAAALGAGTASAQPTTSASTGAGGAPAPAAHAQFARSVLSLGSGYRNPRGSKLVRVLQRELAAGGYTPGHVDGLYGPFTRDAVVAFQAAHGLLADGVVGPRTWAALSEPAPILGPGAGDQFGGRHVVRSLQSRLASAGYSPGPIDGRYGLRTEQAISRFQRAHGMPSNGIAGLRTFALLAKPEPSVHRATPLPQTPAPATTRSSLRPRRTGSTVAPAPREHPAGAARRVPEGSAHRPRSGTVPWMIILGGLALALALALVARLLIASPRHATPLRKGMLALPEKAGSHGGSAESERTSLTTPNGEHEAVAGPDRDRIHTNGHHSRTDAAGIGDGANSGLARGRTDDPPEPAETASAFKLSPQLAGQGGVIEAHAANGHADERDHGTAASNLGRLLEEQGALAEAEAAYRRADELGESAGAFHLGLLLVERGALAEAEEAFRRADERGDAVAAFNLGVLLEERRALTEAEASYRRADERGDANGAFGLAALLKERGARDEAVAAYGRASGRGHNGAAVELGLLLAEHGALGPAEEEFRRADERGDAVAAFNLGVLLVGRGELAEAEAAYHRARQRGDGEVAEMARAELLELA